MERYEDALQFWYSRINYEKTTASPSDLKLDRMHELLSRLGNPHHHLPILHVAGSKGKGSTAAILATILQRAGYRTGLFTSPHLVDVTERCQVDRKPISPDELLGILRHIQMALESGPVLDATFFEIGVAVGFLHFVQKKVEIAVVEVGLGGRFDSTNVCQPLVALITSISFDHVRQLGPTLARIAGEKAGIIKPGAPTISGAMAEEAITVIEDRCRDQGSRLLQLGRDFHYRYEPGRVSTSCWEPPTVHIEMNGISRSLAPGLLGEHQAANVSVALACVEELRQSGWDISEEAIEQGVARTVWPARLEVMERAPLVILDCAHNVASAEALIRTLDSSFPPAERNGNRSLIFAGSHDKDLEGMLGALAPHFSEVLLTNHPHHPRLIPPEEVAELLRKVSSVPYRIYDNAKDAWVSARSAAKHNDLICITGSVFLAGELRPVLCQERFAAV